MSKLKNILKSDQFFLTSSAFFCMSVIIAAMFSGNFILKFIVVIVFGSLYSAILYVADNNEETNANIIMAITFPMIPLVGAVVLLNEFEGSTKYGKLTFLHAWALCAGALSILFSFIYILIIIR